MWLFDAARGLGIALAVIALYLVSCIRVLNEYERGVISRLGRAMPKPREPGPILVFQPVDHVMRVDLRTIIIFPLPIELLAPFLKTGQDNACPATLTNESNEQPAQFGLTNGPVATLKAGRETPETVLTPSV